VPIFYNSYPVTGLSVQLFILCQDKMCCGISVSGPCCHLLAINLLFFYDLSDWIYQLFTESKAQFCEKACVILHIQLEVTRLKTNDKSVSCRSNWQLSVLHTFLNNSQWRITWINLPHSQLTRFLVYMASISIYIEMKVKQKQRNTTTSWACDKVNENSTWRQLVPPKHWYICP